MNCSYDKINSAIKNINTSRGSSVAPNFVSKIEIYCGIKLILKSL